MAETLENDPRYVRDKTTGLIWHQCESRVLYVDTDRSGVVHHARHLTYFELGRASLMRDLAFPYREVEESGYLYPIIEIGVNYYDALGYDDPMTIHTRPATLERVKIRFDYVVLNKTTQKIACKGFTLHCAVNTKKTPVAVDEKTMYLWKFFPK